MCVSTGNGYSVSRKSAKNVADARTPEINSNVRTTSRRSPSSSDWPLVATDVWLVNKDLNHEKCDKPSITHRIHAFKRRDDRKRHSANVLLADTVQTSRIEEPERPMSRSIATQRRSQSKKRSPRPRERKAWPERHRITHIFVRINVHTLKLYQRLLLVFLSWGSI